MASMFAVRSISNTKIFGVGAHPSIIERIELAAGGAPLPISKEQADYFRTVEGVEVLGEKATNSPAKASRE